MKGTFNFYTKDELDAMNEALAKGGKMTKMAKELVITLNRPASGLYTKLVSISKLRKVGKNAETDFHVKSVKPKLIKVKTTKAKSVVTKLPTAINLPEGFTLEGIAKKVKICSNKFEVYF
jgi:hypothetical protein